MRILSLNDAVAMSVSLSGFGIRDLGFAMSNPAPLIPNPSESQIPNPESHRPSLPLHPRHNFFTDVLWRRLVAIEMHRVGRAPLRARTQVGRVAEHLGQRHPRLDD